ncbi:MAG: MFS transporter [Candidatus Alkanophagales archaeon]
MASKGLLPLLYLSVFLGPFGGNVVLALIPTLERHFNVGISLVAAAITTYMLAFASFQLFSGAISDVYGRRRAITLGLLTFSSASLLCALSTGIRMFLGARALQGLGSAFISPVAMALIGDLFPYERRGRVMAGYSASVTAGIALGPLAGGFFAVVDWRLAFVLQSVLSAVLGCAYAFVLRAPTSSGRERGEVLGAIGMVLRSGKVLRLYLIGFVVFFGNIATLTFLSDALKAVVSADKIGVLLSTFGLVGVAAAPLAGCLTDSVGRKRTLIAGLLVMLCAFSIFTRVRAYAALFVPVSILGVGRELVLTPVNTMVVECVPGARGAASSMYNSFRFLGYGLSPVATLPVYLLYGLNGIFLLCICLVLTNILISTGVRE